MSSSVSPSRIRRLLSYWLPPLLGTLAILALSGDLGSASHTRGPLNWLLTRLTSLSPAQIEALHNYLRKAGHLAAYGTLYCLWFRAFRGDLRLALGRSSLWGLGLCLLLSLVDEGHQAFLSSRTGSGRDVLLDLAGVALGVLAALALRPKGRPEVDAILE